MATEETDTPGLGSRIGAGWGIRTDALGEQLSREEIFEALSNERRRCALYYLRQRDAPVALSDIVDYVAAWQYDQPVSQLDPNDRMCVYSALHQAHLPKLDAAGFVDYDSEAGEVHPRDEAVYAQLYLEYDPGNDIPWSGLYLGLVGIGAFVAGLQALSVFPFEQLEPGLLLWGTLVLVGTAALGHLVHEWRNKLAAADLFEVDR